MHPVPPRRSLFPGDRTQRRRSSAAALTSMSLVVGAMTATAVGAGAMTVGGSQPAYGAPAPGPSATGPGVQLPGRGPGAGAGASEQRWSEVLATSPLAHTNGTVIGPDYTQGTLASEAVGREAVQLTAPGQYIDFTVPTFADAVDVSYALPQGAAGGLSVYVDGVAQPSELSLTSAYSYVGTPYIYGSKTHHFFDDARMVLGRQLRPGDTVRLEVGPSDTALPYTIDLVDFYEVAPPRHQPRGSVSVVGYGADPTGASDSTAAFASAIAAAAPADEVVWVPPGQYRVDSPLHVQKATIEGAGSWYTTLLTNEFVDNTSVVTGPIDLSDFAIQGSTVGRWDDSTHNAINGSLGTGSVVQRLWIQNTNVGLWLQYGNTDVTVRDNVVLDTDADGLNFNGNAVDSTVADNLVRNTGDDGLAIWSYPAADVGDTFVHNTVEQPNLANGIAEYGGTDNRILDNLVVDTNALGSGLTVSNEQFASPGFTTLSGTILVAGNVLVRTGAMNPNWGHPMSALQIDAYDYPIAGVKIRIDGNAILDSPYSAVELVSGDGTGLPITGLSFDDDLVDGAGTVVFQAETQGSAYVAHVRAYDIGVAGTVQDQYPPATPTFSFDLGPGNTGWSLTPTLTYFPNPVPPVP